MMKNDNIKLVIISTFFLYICAGGQLGNSYFDRQLLCALDRAPCDRLGKQVKDSLPEIIGNRCANCTPKQLANAQRIASYVQSKYPHVWNELVDKYGKN